MAHFERTLTVNAPAERVFAYATDVAKLPEHDATVVECHTITPGQVQAHSRLRMKVRDGDREREMEAEVTEYTPTTAFAFHTVGSGAYLRRRYTFTPVADGTQVHIEGELALPGLLGQLKELLGAKRELTRQAEAEGAALKQILEAG
jgi:uncharacterized protein YndB with AHSA1/START domain